MLWRANDRYCESKPPDLLGVREVLSDEVELTGQRKSGLCVKAVSGMLGGALTWPLWIVSAAEV